MLFIASRVVLSSLAYIVALAAVLVVGLGIWTEFHISLRFLGPATLVSLSLFVFLGVPIFGATTWFSRRILGANHFSSVVPLYVFMAGMLLMIVARPPQGVGLGGGDIAARVSVFVAVVGVIVDLVLGETLAKGSDGSGVNDHTGAQSGRSRGL